MIDQGTESPKPGSPEFRTWFLNEYERRKADGVASARICRDLKVSRNTLYWWLRRKNAQGADTLPGRDHSHGEVGGNPQQDTSGETTTTNGGIQ